MGFSVEQLDNIVFAATPTSAHQIGQLSGRSGRGGGRSDVHVCHFKNSLGIFQHYYNSSGPTADDKAVVRRNCVAVHQFLTSPGCRWKVLVQNF